jgi:plastocyanin
MSARAAIALVLLLGTSMASGQHAHHAMTLNRDGMVMNTNAERLPRGCDALGPDYEFTVRASVEYAADTPGMIFGMSQHELRVEPCSRLTVTFHNDDQVRHQWMVHGLPKYLYPTGMFHLEANAGYSVSGTFIVPGDDRTYLIHCDMAQHMEKGMKGQLVVGSGSGDLWSVKGVSDPFLREFYLPAGAQQLLFSAVLAGLVVTLTVIRFR